MGKEPGGGGGGVEELPEASPGPNGWHAASFRGESKARDGSTGVGNKPPRYTLVFLL